MRGVLRFLAICAVVLGAFVLLARLVLFPLPDITARARVEPLAASADRPLGARMLQGAVDHPGLIGGDRAARRGVRVRRLVDDNGVPGLDGVIATLNAGSGVQVRLFNPAPPVDGAVTIIGGAGDRTAFEAHVAAVVASEEMRVLPGDLQNTTARYAQGARVLE